MVSAVTDSALDKMDRIDRKLDELKCFLEDVFITPEEAELLKDADRAVKQKKFGELTPLDEV